MLFAGESVSSSTNQVILLWIILHQDNIFFYDSAYVYKLSLHGSQTMQADNNQGDDDLKEVTTFQMGK